MPGDRRHFLNLLGGTSVFAAAGLPPEPGQALPSHPAPIADTWDVSWADRINGRFRAVFDSPGVSEGAALFRSIFWTNQYKSVYGIERSDMSPVVVFRHEGIVLAMNDEYWRRFKVGKETKTKTMDGKKWVDGNPIAIAPPDTPPQFANYNLKHFQSVGGIVLGCNLAFRDIVDQFAKADKLEAKEAAARAREHLVPGVILQPSGVFAVLRAQEAGCKYILGS